MTQTPASAASAAIPAAEATGIHMRFGSTQALRGVDLALWPGRCTGLVGRNGAGKSTLVSILSGRYPPDRGTVRLDGSPAPPLGAVDAWQGRIATVFQHSMVVPGLTVAENVFLGRPPRRGGLVDWRRMRAQTAQIMADWGFEIDVSRPCSALTVEQRQIVEIARALAAGTRCLLLDEPTAALERAAIERMFARIRQLVASGVAVLYISHHLEEVFEICQDVTVLRDGQVVMAGPTAGLSKNQMVAAMVGPDLIAQRAPGGSARRTGPVGHASGKPAAAAAAVVVEHVSAQAPTGRVADVCLDIAPGERLGLTGLLSAGVVTLARIVAGAAPYEAGQVTVDGRPLLPGRRDLALRAGIGYIPEDRQADGFVPLLGVAENATMTITDWLARLAGFLLPGARAEATAPLVSALSISCAGLGQPVGQLSGGNQQKVVAARALARKPRVIVAIAPTRGVDVASKALLLAELARVSSETGAGLLLATDELDDLVICDRVIVLVRGARFAEFTDPPFDREALIAATEGLVLGADGPHNRQGMP